MNIRRITFILVALGLGAASAITDDATPVRGYACAVGCQYDSTIELPAP